MEQATNESFLREVMAQYAIAELMAHELAPYPSQFLDDIHTELGLRDSRLKMEFKIDDKTYQLSLDIDNERTSDLSCIPAPYQMAVRDRMAEIMFTTFIMFMSLVETKDSFKNLKNLPNHPYFTTDPHAFERLILDEDRHALVIHPSSRMHIYALIEEKQD